MRYDFAKWEIVGFIFTVIFGSLLHFVYHWSRDNQIIGIVSPVNESTWEHLKLLFVPMTFFSIIEFFIIGKDIPNFIAAKAFGILVGMIAIIAIFYTYTGILGKHYLWADILTFIIGVAVSYLCSLRIINKYHFCSTLNWGGFVLLTVIFVFFAVFTFFPPKLPLFIDPITQRYGLS